MSIRSKGGGTVDIVRSVLGRPCSAVASVRASEDGQAMVEYALILFIVSIAAIGVLTQIGGQISSLFSEINASI